MRSPPCLAAHIEARQHPWCRIRHNPNESPTPSHRRRTAQPPGTPVPLDADPRPADHRARDRGRERASRCDHTRRRRHGRPILARLTRQSGTAGNQSTSGLRRERHAARRGGTDRPTRRAAATSHPPSRSGPPHQGELCVTTEGCTRSPVPWRCARRGDRPESLMRTATTVVDDQDLLCRRRCATGAICHSRRRRSPGQPKSQTQRKSGHAAK